MNVVSSLPYLSTLKSGISFVSNTGKEFLGKTVNNLSVLSKYLDDPRFASLSVFCVNFVILELATRLGEAADFVMPRETPNQRNIKICCITVVVGGLIIAGNMVYIKMSKVKLHPFIVAALIVFSYVVKFQMQNIIKNN